MSLVGNLEELDLGEILQIIGLSRKSGTLSLRSTGCEAVIVFSHGQVVRASSSQFPQSLGELLTTSAVIDPIVLRKALALQQSEGFLERLGAILVKHFNINPEVIEEVVARQVEKVVLSLFDLTSGSFDFQVQDLVETVYDTRMDPLQFMLKQGLNPQLLAMEGAQEERRRVDDGEAVFERPDGRVVAEPRNPLVVVDDDAPTLQAVTAGLREAGYEVFPLEHSEDTLITVESLLRRGNRPTVLIDLIMPRMDGTGVLGGIELMEQLQGNFGDLPLILISDYRYGEAEAHALERGCPLLIKPRRSEITRPEVLGEFIDLLLFEINRMNGEAEASRERKNVNLGDELRLEMEDDAAPAPSSGEAASGADALLGGMLEELKNADTQGGVALLLLRFAAEFVNRAVVFAVHDMIVSGVGQFGICEGAITGDERVRAINFPLGWDSMFREAGKSGRSGIFTPAMTPLDCQILKQLGGDTPAEVFIGPIMGSSGLIGFLYGDNLPDGGPLSGTETLAMFLALAGSAMERGLQPSRGRA
ncbi:response regulator [Pelobacter propionicus]|uniref:Response regulator receiver protein n=1 Tax=Pelobacter propionicus (strain DSM 2379 / NBRC 103807 / OttBd1) TaxID=338966 RepID=A1APS0_PELPD|nr:response regulator [Pelobacter propionicus]ABK99340.1 response regulator receiver protein [Pelobacter propionicus DSM 2379]